LKPNKYDSKAEKPIVEDDACAFSFVSGALSGLTQTDYIKLKAEIRECPGTEQAIAKAHVLREEISFDPRHQGPQAIMNNLQVVGRAAKELWTPL